MNEQQITPEQAFGILAAEHAELIVQKRLLLGVIANLEAQVKALTPPPEGEAKPAPTLEAVK